MTVSELERAISMASLVVVVAASVACDDSKPAPEAPKETASSPSADPVPPAAAVDGVEDGEWCSLAHEETVKLVEGIRASMKANGQDEADYAPPARDAYVERCRRLPLAMRKCLVISYSTQNQEACLEAERALSPDERETYQALMGK